MTNIITTNRHHQQQDENYDDDDYNHDEDHQACDLHRTLTNNCISTTNANC